MLSDKQLKDVCLYSNRDHRTCRYIEEDDNIFGKCYCNKKRPIQKKKIDMKISDFIKDCKKTGVDPRSINEPLGDNCPGYAFLKTKLQGYDEDKKKP